MFRKALLWWLLALAPVVSYGEERQILFEDFESGLGGWTIEHEPYVDLAPDIMVAFPAGGAGMYGPIDDRFGVWGGSQCVGHSQNISPPWDGTSDHWIQKQWPGQLTPGTYSVHIEYDMYVYVDNVTRWPGGGNWAVGNRVYLLTDEDYNYPCFDFDNGDPSPGFEISYWPGWDNYEDVYCNGDLDPPYACVGGGNAGLACADENGDASDDLCQWAYNGVWRRVSQDKTVTTATGNLELRLLKHEKDWDTQTVAWDDVDLVIKDSGDNTVFEFHDNFNGPDPLAGWQNVMSCREAISNNDQPRLFASSDPLLYDNIDNPGTQSAGYSDAEEFKDKTDRAWLKRLFPNALPAGTVENPTVATMKLEFDWYVFEGALPYSGPDNNSPTVFPAPDGAGILGPNGTPDAPYPGSTSVGYASNLAGSDPIGGAYLQKLFPNALPAGTYDVEWKMDRYVYYGGGEGRVGNRIVLLTGSRYNQPWFGIGSDSDDSKRFSYWSDSDKAQTGEWWIQWQPDPTPFSFTTDGNIEIRLSGYDDTGGSGGEQTAAWDNMSLVFKDQSTGEVVWSTTDDFEDGLDGWTAKVELGLAGDPYYVGNRIYVLTDDLYDGQDPTQFPGTGFLIERWPGAEPDGSPYDWSWNGHWRHGVVEQDFTTVSGNLDLRLLFRQKYAGWREVVAWDNVKLSFILPCNTVRFDADGDGDVDQSDFAVFQRCYTGDGVALSNAEVCQCMNSDGKQSDIADVDAIDLQAFEACASGPGLPASASCYTPPSAP
jgi:hypothetical protein